MQAMKPELNIFCGKVKQYLSAVPDNFRMPEKGRYGSTLNIEEIHNLR